MKNTIFYNRIKDKPETIKKYELKKEIIINIILSFYQKKTCPQSQLLIPTSPWQIIEEYLGRHSFDPALMGTIDLEEAIFN